MFESVEQYQTWLTALLVAHSELGRSSAQLLGNPAFSTTEQTRCALLESDLNRHCPDHIEFRLKTKSWAWGVQYALNGSSLGASVLLKSGALGRAWPREYLKSMKEFATSGALKQFFAALDDEPFSVDEAVAGAESVFGLLVDRAHLGNRQTRGRKLHFV